MKRKIISKLSAVLCSAFSMYLLIAITSCRSSRLFEGASSETQIGYKDCVVGLLPREAGGSDLVLFDTDKWESRLVKVLPDVLPDNYAAMSGDGNYVAYTTWNGYYTLRYLVVLSLATGVERTYFDDIPPQSEIIKLSWLADNETVIFILNDTEISQYQAIKTLNVRTEYEVTIDKGEVWKVREAEELGKKADDFYLKGHDSHAHVKSCAPANENEVWNYYMDHNDISEIFRYYGGTRDFDFGDVLNLMYVEFSAPRRSPDGTKIAYSATLKRNSAPGEETPLWMCSSIWMYDVEKGNKAIVHSQADEGAIGRVEWISDNEICFVAYYEFQGSRDSINYLNMATGEERIVFNYSDEHYNNVTLLPVGSGNISFTSSAKEMAFDESQTYILNIDSEDYASINIIYKGKPVLLERFAYVRLAQTVK
jgi:hypothetical protein